MYIKGCSSPLISPSQVLSFAVSNYTQLRRLYPDFLHYHFRGFLLVTHQANMQFFNFMIVAVAMLSGAEACKCVNGGQDVGATRDCCASLRGNFNGNDCKAGSISEHLSNFRSCCRSHGETSDCDCPTCKRDLEGNIIEEENEKFFAA